MMTQERNPLFRKGERNAFCLFYASCLDEAVGKSWAYWDCSECEYRLNRDQQQDITNYCHETTSYYDTFADIFD